MTEQQPLTLEQAEAFAKRVLAAIDVDDPVARGADEATVIARDADRARVAADLEGLRGAQRHPGRGLEEADLRRLRVTFSDGLIRTGAAYGVRP